MNRIDLIGGRLVGEGVAVLEGVQLGRSVLWTRAKARKVWSCASCRSKIAKGGHAWRSMTERGGVARYTRLCDACIAEVCEVEVDPARTALRGALRIAREPDVRERLRRGLQESKP